MEMGSISALVYELAVEASLTAVVGQEDSASSSSSKEGDRPEGRLNEPATLTTRRFRLLVSQLTSSQGLG